MVLPVLLRVADRATWEWVRRVVQRWRENGKNGKEEGLQMEGAGEAEIRKKLRLLRQGKSTVNYGSCRG